MTRLALPTLALLVVGCTTTDERERPTSCDRNARVGVYRATFVEQSGTCGPVDSQLINLTVDPPSGSGCTLTTDAWAEGGCKLTRDLTCPDLRTVTVSRAMTSDASEISGTQTITIFGAGACTSTYAIELVRQ